MAGPPLAFGEQLRAYRLRAGLTQQELAERSGVGLRTVRDLECGRVGRPRARSVELLVAALGLAQAEGDRLRSAGAASAAGGAGPLWIGVLGPLEVRRGDVAVEVRGAGLRCLLGLLAVQPGQVVPRDEIVDVLWQTEPPAGYPNLIQVYVARLRRLVEPQGERRSGFRVLVRAGVGYRLDLDRAQLDVAAFDALLARARQARAEGRTEMAEQCLGQALACWRGPVLGGIEPRVAQHPQVVALGSRRVDAALGYAELAVGPGGRVAGVLRPIAAEEPLHEGLHARLMLTLAADGQQAAALAVFETIRDRLAEELGIEPGAQLRQAQAQVLRQDLPGGARAGDPSEEFEETREWTRPAQLPADVAGFTGRTTDLAHLDTLLAGDPPHTVVISAIDGMAGIGKTALAVHWAHHSAPHFPDGQLYINLRGWATGEPLRPIEALAGFLRALGVPADQVPTHLDEAAAMLRSLLAGRRVLMILDNARDAAQIRPLLPGTPGCLVLVTSRDRLSGLVARDGAHRISLDVLTTTEAHALLTHLLGAPRIQAEPPATTNLIRACAFLPLALRIAAAHLLDQPHQSITDYLTELAGDRLGALELPGDEQAAVRAAFDLSYARLDPATRRLFRLLALAPGPDIAAPAAAALTDTPLPDTRRLLDRLAGAHLLTPTAPARYGFHDLLRVYATERATTDDSPDERHTALHRLYRHYLTTAHTASDLLYPQMLRLPAPPAASGAAPLSFADHDAALAWLDAERATLVAVITHTARHGPYEIAWRLADVLRGYLSYGLHTVEWLTAARAAQAAAVADAHPQAQAAAEINLGTHHWFRGRYHEAIDHNVRALELARRADWTPGQAAILVNLGALHGMLGELAQATEHLTGGVALARRIGDVSGQALGMANLGFLWYQRGQLARAADHHDQALALYRKLGSLGGRADTLADLGHVHRMQGHLRHAEDLLRQCLTLHREAGERHDEPGNLGLLAEVHTDAGRLDEALELTRTALGIARETGNRVEETGTLIASATVHQRLGDHTRALEHYRQALRGARDLGYPYLETDALLGMADSLTALDEPAQARTTARHGLMLARTTGFRLLEGRAQATLAAIAHRLGEHRQAAETARTALAIHTVTGYRLGAARTHLLLGHILHDLGDPDTADRHWREALTLFTDIGTPEADRARALLTPVAHSGAPPA